jgi:hypothetical protein
VVWYVVLWTIDGIYHMATTVVTADPVESHWTTLVTADPVESVTWRLSFAAWSSCRMRLISSCILAYLILDMSGYDDR